MVYDALRAFDVLAAQRGVRGDKIVMAGESMGGRIALIAAAIDKRISGAVVFSTSGFGAQTPQNARERFVATLNPDMYVGELAPRKLVMFHAKNDSVVPFSQAQLTFSIAKEPKRFIEMPKQCEHGYCNEVYDEFVREVEWVVEK